VTYSFDDANRRTADSAGGTYTADPDGRLTARPGQRLEWDSLGRLTKVRPPSGNSTLATYTYDPLDRLLLADYGGNNRTRFRYVGLTSTIAQEVNDQTGVVIRSEGTDTRGSQLEDWTGTGQNVRFYGTNAHHDGTWTADATGAVSATLRYDPWGVLTAWTGASLPEFRFQGSWYDPTTDLAWVVARWYAPAQGQFVSEDSLLGDPADPPSRHLYAYGQGEPVTRWDPTGMYPLLPSTQPNSIEQWTCNRYPSLCSNWKYAGALAIIWSTLDWTTAAATNGVRHCMWQCLLTYWEGWNWANYWGWAHEAGAPVYHPLDTTVDLHNNYVGRLFGSHLGGVASAGPALMAHYFCVQAWRNGWLWYVSRDLRIRWSDGRLVNP
jgi:RHS repeat-associated protein